MAFVFQPHIQLVIQPPPSLAVPTSTRQYPTLPDLGGDLAVFVHQNRVLCGRARESLLRLQSRLPQLQHVARRDKRLGQLDLFRIF